MQTNHTTPPVGHESDNLTFSRRYFLWYTVGCNAAGLVSGAALMWLYFHLKAAGVLP